MHNHMAYFDIENKQIGFAKANCLNQTDYQPPKYNETEINKTKQIIDDLDQSNWGILIFLAIGIVIFGGMLLLLIIICKRKCRTKIINDPRRVSSPDAIEIVVK